MESSGSESLFSMSPPPAPRRRQREPRRPLLAEDSNIARRLFPPAIEEQGPAPISESMDAVQQHEQMNFTFHNLVMMGGPYLQLWREEAGLGGFDLWPILPSERRSAFKKLLKAAVCVILGRCELHMDMSRCDGCRYDQGNQEAHDCLSRGSDFYDRILTEICQNLKILPVLKMCLFLGCALDCFAVTQNTVLYIGKLVMKIGNAESPAAVLEKFRQKCLPEYVALVKKYLSQPHMVENLLEIFL
ncbi:uncharacterized protein LOC125424913 [Sphaerodactylus townsendi]|uniref:uncharacterized protein LOC125424913 n=1 Tax=Sphaerodactylus townsendi TaxID=933632 RepID=UPI002025DE1C|nr:uncharacterized protein LOC125424913 [Sphaerodactylus townsendi]